MEEYNDIAQYKNIYLRVFEKGSHTRVYPEYKEEYTEAVGKFLKGELDENSFIVNNDENIEKIEQTKTDRGSLNKNEEKETGDYENFSDFDYE